VTPIKISVIVPSHNAAATLGCQLEALAAQRCSQPWEVIVVDNCSTDDTQALVDRYCQRMPNLRLVEAFDRPGAAYARNAGARAAHGEYLAFIDADDEAAPAWVAAIGKALAEHDFVASRFDGTKLNPAWLLRSRPCPQQEGLQQYRYPPFLPHAGGCGLGIRRAVFEMAGGFDETALALEDTDLCFRVQLHGFPLHFAQEAVVNIRYADNAKGMYRQALAWGEWNVFLYKRYRPQGMPKLSRRAGLQAWWKLFKSMPWLRSQQDFGRWFWQFAWRLGRVRGCLKYQVWAV
jgi:glycosyltransferase involved in cell wall biosynthesis